MLRFILLVPVFIIFGVTPALSQESEQQQLKELERDIEKSQTLEQDLKEKAGSVASEASAITGEIIAKAREIQDREEDLVEIEAGLQVLSNQIAAKKEDILTQNKNISFTLAALQRLSQRPPEFILMRPAKAVETVRSASLLTSTLPEIEKRADSLKEDLAELAVLNDKAVIEETRLRESLKSLQAENASLEALQREKRALYADYLADAEQQRARTTRLAREAKDLENLIERLENELKTNQQNALPTPPIPPGSSFAKGRRQLPYPARGTVTMRFGDKIPAGTAKGLNIKTVSGGQVIAPFDGRIIFAGEFRNYGQLLIIAHGDGYHTLLAGMRRIDVLVGQWVLAGEPIGVMPETRLASTESDVTRGGPELYLEIRRNGQPINPLPWLKK
ncbi:MAG: peptidoglycan DD-metalloendopeptidase family protein [Sphingomonadales bacterium]